MRLYKVVKKFGPESGAEWREYLSFTHLKHLNRFDSVDGILRADMFEPETAEDWQNCVNEDFKLNLITDFAYAKKVQAGKPGSQIVPVEIELDESYSEKPGCLGYDILDGYCNVSLLTNWGSSGEPFRDFTFEDNGLISTLGEALKLRDRLRSDYSDDPHASNCGVWAIYEISS